MQRGLKKGTLGNPSWITTGSSQTGSGKIQPKGKSSWPGTEWWQEAEGRQLPASLNPALPSPSSTHAAFALVHGYWLDWSPVCIPCPPPISTSFPIPDRAPRTMSHPDTSCPGIPAPHLPSVLLRQPLCRAAVMLWVLITWPLSACPAGDTQHFPSADRHSEGCRGLPVTY